MTLDVTQLPNSLTQFPFLTREFSFHLPVAATMSSDELFSEVSGRGGNSRACRPSRESWVVDDGTRLIAARHVRADSIRKRRTNGAFSSGKRETAEKSGRGLGFPAASLLLRVISPTVRANDRIERFPLSVA